MTGLRRGRARRALGWAAGATLLGCCGRADPPRDAVEERTEYYAVSGASARDLRWALDQLGPPNDQGGRSDAVTRWKFDYTYGLSESRSGCAVVDLETEATITTTLPRWTHGPGAPADLVARFDAYVTCAALHETGHKRIYLDALAGFRRRVEALGPRPSCREAERALAAVAQETLAGVQDEQLGYEERSDHGYRQCGRFP